MTKYTYYQVMEYPEDKKDPRRIYTFNNEMAAHELVEIILKNDPMPIDIRVEEHEITT